MIVGRRLPREVVVVVDVVLVVVANFCKKCNY
jgi:hypothetical protein